MVSAFVLGGVSLDPSEEFIVARTAGNTWLTLAISNSLRCFISSSLRFIFISSYSFFHSSLSRAIALYSFNLACSSLRSFLFFSEVSIVSEV